MKEKSEPFSFHDHIFCNVRSVGDRGCMAHIASPARCRVKSWHDEEFIG